VTGEWRLFRGPLSGSYFVGRVKQTGPGVFEVAGRKYDVTADVQTLMRVALEAARAVVEDPSPMNLEQLRAQLAHLDVYEP
jgi:hypothetical protein